MVPPHAIADAGAQPQSERVQCWGRAAAVAPRTSAKLAQLAEAGLPYISLCTDPTTGGTTASYAMLGDINIAEPGALIGFAGPRVVKEATGKDLPDDFQTSEFLLEHGFLDFIVHRKALKNKVNLYIDLIQNKAVREAVS